MLLVAGGGAANDGPDSKHPDKRLTVRVANGDGRHSGALAVKEMGGSLNVPSDGIVHGATFILELPLEPEKHAP